MEKEKYIELVKDFLADKMSADDFSYSFMNIYERICRKLDPMKRNEALEFANFLKPSRPELGELLARIYRSCDSFSPDPEIAISDEKELKDDEYLVYRDSDKKVLKSVNYSPAELTQFL